MWGLDDRVRIDNPLGSLSDEEVKIDATRFVNGKAQFLSDKVDEVCRAAHLAKHTRFYEQIARGYNPRGIKPPIALSGEEQEALRRERDRIVSEKGLWMVVITVSLAAFLQGFVQSSFAGANIYEGYWRNGVQKADGDPHQLGITNGIPYLAAALIGCPLADPVNQIAGRRGALFFAAFLVAVTSIAAASLPSFDEEGQGRSHAWKSLIGIRVVNGIGMGIKAVTAPILASETAIGYWRGSAILAWQLWVAFGIFASNAFNLLFFLSPHAHVSLRLILASPMVPAIMLAISVYFTPESPRFYLRPHRGSYNLEKAYGELKKLRNTELQALRDLYLIHRSVDFSDSEMASDSEGHARSGNGRSRPAQEKPTLMLRFNEYFSRYRELFTNSRLRNSTISSCTVALGQQLCGINIFAFYANTLFLKVIGGIRYDGNEDENKEEWRAAMLYSFAFGLTNFLFGIPALGTIDTFGRRKWLLVTIPGMAVALMAAALGLLHPDPEQRKNIVLIFMLIHTVFYSPAMGPVPFTLASEAFPLSHRENGCSVAVMVNLFFAGGLAWFYPLIDHDLGGKKDVNQAGGGGALGLFAGLNVVALIMVYLLVEETKQKNLEDLDQIFNVSKRKFAKFQATVYLPWMLRRAFLCSDEEKPDFYEDTTNEVTPPDEDGWTRQEVLTPRSPPPPSGIYRNGYEIEATDLRGDDRPGSRSRYD